MKFGVLNTAACLIAPRTCAGGGDDGGGGGGGGDTTFIFAPAPSACRPSSSQPHRPCPYLRPSQCAVSEGTTAVCKRHFHGIFPVVLDVSVRAV